MIRYDSNWRELGRFDLSDSAFYLELASSPDSDGNRVLFVAVGDANYGSPVPLDLAVAKDLRDWLTKAIEAIDGGSV